MNKSINEYFRKFIENHSLLDKDVKILIAVSGGLDSMVLLDLFNRAGCLIEVATVNYQLRAHADVEARCVKDYCLKHHIPFHLREITSKEKESLKQSNLQEKARTIRYDFFNQVILKSNCSHLATAHHQDDVVESFFLSLKRGAGLKGLSPMTTAESNLLRPLIPFEKKELIQHAHNEGIHYEEDESNLTDDYDRNYIRNQVMPLLEKRFSNIKASILTSSKHISESKNLLDELIKKNEHQFLEKTKGQTIVNLNEIRKLNSKTTLLYQLVSPMGFNGDQCTEMIDSESKGALWHSEKYQATTTIDQLIISLKPEAFTVIRIYDTGETRVPNEGKIIISKVKRPRFEKSKNIEYIDADLLEFPLIIRRWQAGDRMKPIGMKGQSKKVQDLLTDAKINRISKSKCLVLTFKDKIVWLVNFRLDERFKVGTKTKSYYKLEYKFGAK